MLIDFISQLITGGHHIVYKPFKQGVKEYSTLFISERPSCTSSGEVAKVDVVGPQLSLTALFAAIQAAWWYTCVFNIVYNYVYIYTLYVYIYVDMY